MARDPAVGWIEAGAEAAEGYASRQPRSSTSCGLGHNHGVDTRPARVGSEDQLEARRRPGPPLSEFVWEFYAVAGVLARSPPRSSAPCTTAHAGSCLVVAAFVPPGWLAVEFVRVEAAVLEFLRRMPRLLRFAEIRRFIVTRSAQISASVATAKEGHGRGLDDYCESIPHELICLGVHSRGTQLMRKLLNPARDRSPLRAAHGDVLVSPRRHHLLGPPRAQSPCRPGFAGSRDSRASFNPSINAWYSATLWVAGPIAFEI